MLTRLGKGTKPRLKEGGSRLFAAAVLLLLFVIGLSVSEDYFMGTDEVNEIMILQKNIRTVGETFFGPDSQLVYLYEDMGLSPIETDIDRDHGQAAYYPFALYLFQPKFLSGNYGYTSVAVPYHYYTFILCFTAIISFYLLVSELFSNRRLALLCAIILFVMPRFFAESHYNNKDMVLFALLMDLCCFGVRAIKRRRLADALLFALFSALAANAKILGLFFFGISGLFYIAYISIKKLWDRRSAGIMLLAILSFIVLFYALTPAMWKDPVGYFSYCLNNTLHFSRWSGLILFDGRIYNTLTENLPGRYIPQLMLLTTPIYISVLAAAGFVVLCAALFKKGLRSSPSSDKLFFVLMICCCAFVPLLVQIVNKSLVYNGWRHFYFSFVGVIMLAAVGLELLLRRWPRLAAALALTCVLFTSVQNIVNHPYQYVYFNPLAGEDVVSNYELDYWAVSTREAVRFAAENSSGEISMACLDDRTYHHLVYSLEYLSPEDKARITILDEGDTHANFIIQNTTYAIVRNIPPIPEDFRLVNTIYAYGEPLVDIYGRS